MKNLTITFFLLIVFLGQSIAQKNELFMPYELKRAYLNKTRSLDGKSGENYFQNSSDYKMKINFDLEKCIIKGSATITYSNNSPDTLKYLIFRLYQDFYKKGNARAYSIGDKDLHDGTIIEELIISGNKVDLEKKSKNRNTNLFVRVSQEITPKSKTEIKIKWETPMPDDIKIRYGKYGDATYFAAFCYPKIAVYDDVYGWDREAFNGQQEFYGDYNNYDVEIIVPNNNLVWATGELQNSEEIYQKKYLKKIKKAATSDKVHHILTKEDIKKGKILKENKNRIWHFKAENVTDFAFATSDNFLWDATSVVVDKKTGRRVIVNSVYKEASKDFHQVAEVSTKSLKILSEDVYGIPYQYPQMTAFNGSGGMEFPMMINDGDANDYEGTVFVTAHEIGHSYFPFLVGSNEKRYAWFDEGITTLMPKIVEEKLIPKEQTAHLLENYNKYYGGSEHDLPIMIPSTQTSGGTYSVMAYNIGAIAIHATRISVGEETFKKCLIEYITRWRGKHPTPYDFFNTVNDVTNQNLDWFWNKWFFSFGSADLSIKSVKQDKDNLKIVVENSGGKPLPIKLLLTFESGLTKEVSAKFDVWKNSNAWTFEGKEKNKVVKIELGNSLIPDTNSDNNTYELKKENF